MDVDFENVTVTVEDYLTKEKTAVKGCTIIGGDGANSAVRNALEATYKEHRSNVDWLDHGYKELTMPPAKDGAFALEKNALHIF